MSDGHESGGINQEKVDRKCGGEGAGEGSLSRRPLSTELEWALPISGEEYSRKKKQQGQKPSEGSHLEASRAGAKRQGAGGDEIMVEGPHEVEPFCVNQTCLRSVVS